MAGPDGTLPVKQQGLSFCNFFKNHLAEVIIVITALAMAAIGVVIAAHCKTILDMSGTWKLVSVGVISFSVLLLFGITIKKVEDRRNLDVFKSKEPVFSRYKDLGIREFLINHLLFTGKCELPQKIDKAKVEELARETFEWGKVFILVPNFTLDVLECGFLSTKTCEELQNKPKKVHENVIRVVDRVMELLLEAWKNQLRSSL